MIASPPLFSALPARVLSKSGPGGQSGLAGVDIAPSRDWHPVYAAGHVRAYCPDAASPGPGICAAAAAEDAGWPEAGTVAETAGSTKGRWHLSPLFRRDGGSCRHATGWPSARRAWPAAGSRSISARASLTRSRRSRSVTLPRPAQAARTLGSDGGCRTHGGQRTGMYKW